MPSSGFDLLGHLDGGRELVGGSTGGGLGQRPSAATAALGAGGGGGGGGGGGAAGSTKKAFTTEVGSGQLLGVSSGTTITTARRTTAWMAIETGSV